MAKKTPINPANVWNPEDYFFTNSGSRRDISAIVRRCAEAAERKEGHFMERCAGTSG